jgi:uncharacterized protein YnzC (UPF0291/DUF896 family)
MEVSDYKSEIAKLYKEIEKCKAPLLEKINELKDEMRQYIVKNKLYITDLSEFNGKHLSNITAIDSNGEDVYLPNDEIVEVVNGKLYCSSYSGGIVGWDSDENSYYHTRYYVTKKLDILGFTDIVES